MQPYLIQLSYLIIIPLILYGIFANALLVYYVCLIRTSLNAKLLLLIAICDEIFLIGWFDSLVHVRITLHSMFPRLFYTMSCFGECTSCKYNSYVYGLSIFFSIT